MSRHSYARTAEAHPGHREVSGGLARAAVFGMSDGLTSNVLLVIGFAGAAAGSGVVRLAGLAGALAGAISMAAGEWVSVTAQNELVQRELAVERRELDIHHDAETRELAGIYREHGMEPATAAQAAADVMRDTDRALIVHAREEFGLDPTSLPSAWGAAVLSFVCFVIGAIVPVVPWFIGSGTGATVASIGIGVAATAALGWVIGIFAETARARSALRQVAIMVVAAALTFAVGKAVGISVG